jgi:hypothetical protein
MKNFAIINQYGRVVQKISGTGIDIGELKKSLTNKPEFLHVIEVEGFVQPDWQIGQDGRIAALPPRPSVNHEYDYAARQWRLNADRAWGAVRVRRDKLLTDSDWIVIRAADQGEPVPQAWREYRKKLREITRQTADPTAIQWPEPPSET